MRFGVYCFLLFVICCTSCKKKTEPLPDADPVSTTMALQLDYITDNGSFQTNAFTYTTPAGYPYSVTKLEYYLSQICLLRSDSSKLLMQNYQYVDATQPQTNTLSYSNPPTGNYIGISFNIGLIPSQNTTGALPEVNDNINMQWPDPMGGGYHFLKMEGYYKDAGVPQGYAMHLGTNKCLIPTLLYKKFSISTGSEVILKPLMNINSWFRSPYKFDFNKDGNYIMGNDTAMLKITANGKNVFSL